MTGQQTYIQTDRLVDRCRDSGQTGLREGGSNDLRPTHLVRTEAEGRHDAAARRMRRRRYADSRDKLGPAWGDVRLYPHPRRHLHPMKRIAGRTLRVWRAAAGDV